MVDLKFILSFEKKSELSLPTTFVGSFSKSCLDNISNVEHLSLSLSYLTFGRVNISGDNSVYSTLLFPLFLYLFDLSLCLFSHCVSVSLCSFCLCYLSDLLSFLSFQNFLSFLSICLLFSFYLFVNAFTFIS